MDLLILLSFNICFIFNKIYLLYYMILFLSDNNKDLQTKGLQTKPVILHFHTFEIFFYVYTRKENYDFFKCISFYENLSCYI